MKVLAFFFLLIPALTAGEVKVDKLTIGSRTFEGVTITKDDALTAKLVHSSGISRFPIASLSSEHRQALGYDPDAAAELAARQIQQALASRKRAALLKELQTGPILRITVQTVLSNGLLGETMVFDAAGKYQGTWDAFIELDTTSTNYIDQAVYKFDGVETGTFSFTTVLGAQRTVRKFTEASLYVKKRSQNGS